MRFKVVGVKQKRWWTFPRFAGSEQVVMQIQHDNPHDWPLDGLLKFYSRIPGRFKVGEVYSLELTRFYARKSAPTKEGN